MRCLRLSLLADLALRPALSTYSSGVRSHECGQTTLVGGLRGENARLRQEVEYLRAETARLGEANAKMHTLLDDFDGLAETVGWVGSTVTDAQAELLTTRKALEAVLALHQDANGYCTHCRRAHRCPTVAAIETGSQQAREQLWRLQEES